MGWGLGNAGGSFSSAVAIIYVDYPIGSTCICYESGGKTLRARGDTGSYIFLIPEYGSWTVKIYNDSHPEGKTKPPITINTYGQMVRISIAYGLSLFENGDNTEITGGWVSSGTKTTILTSSSIGFTVYSSGESGSYRARGIRTLNKINVSDYTQLKADITDVYDDAQEMQLVLLNDTDLLNNAKYSVRILQKGTVTLNIEDIDPGEYYVGLRFYYRDYGIYDNIVLESSKIWLE